MNGAFRAGFLVLLLCFGIRVETRAQNGAPDAVQLFRTARKFISSGDYANGILVLNQAIQQEPANREFREELALAYYLNKNYDRAQAVTNPLIRNGQGGEMSFEISGNIDQARGDNKAAQKIFAQGIRKFPNSGQLYEDMGLMYFSQEKYPEALQNWIRGIQMDPSFPGNYYNASRTYYYSRDKVWAILYGEVFINMESFTLRTAEIKGILLESYKKIFDDPRMFSGLEPASRKGRGREAPEGPDFRQAFLEILSKESSVVSRGITPETLVMLRTRFILDWDARYGREFPYYLFDYQRDLLRAGLFEAYNQWIFGPGADRNRFKDWANLHPDQLNAFLNYRRDHPIQVNPGEYYNQGNISFDSKVSR